MSYIGRQLNVPASVFEAVADGSITAGSTVVIKSTGKVANVTDQSASNSTPAQVAGGNRLAAQDSAYDSSQNCILISYQNETSSYKACVRAATLSGSTLTFGSEVQTDMIATGRVSIASDNNGGFILISEDSNQSNKQFAVAGTVSGTTITIGDDAEYSDSTYSINDVMFDSASGKFVIVYVDNQNSSVLTAKVVTRSGTSFSLGTAVVVSSESYLYGCRCTEDTDENRVVVFASGTSHVRCVAGAVSGTTTSWGSVVQVGSAVVRPSKAGIGEGNACGITYDSSAKATVFGFTNNEGSSRATLLIATLSGSTATLGSLQVVDSGNKGVEVGCAYDPTVQKVIVAFGYGDSIGPGNFVSATITGGSSRSATFSSKTEFESGNTATSCVVHHTSAGKNVITFMDESDSNIGKYVIQASQFQNFTDFIGFTDTTYDDGDLVKVQVGGSVNDLQSGLTAGQTYFVQTDGSIGTSAASTSVTAGTAVSATEILVKG
tara:strand:- start:91 stop:1566 length:1476 start_codon:yes stop_codon:yes gene_type:complete